MAEGDRGRQDPEDLALLLRRLHVAERIQQRHVVDDLEHAAERPAAGPANGVASSAPASAGLIADARLRGTAVTLAAAVRSAGVTTAIT